MIKAAELRIGNWVRNRYGDVWRITGQDITWCSLKSHKYYWILLTPELLLKCGFVGIDSDDLPKRTVYGIQVANNTALYYDEFCDKLWYLSYEWNNNHFQNDFWAKPKYLHQLQNLYYALTGEELKIELP